MDFQAPNCVIEALRSYVDFGVFGYSPVPNEWFDEVISWERRRHGYEIKREWICFSSGVVSGFNWLLQAFTNKGDAVIIQSPVYYPFSNAVLDNERKLVESELVRVGDSYVMDLEDLEKKIVENNVKAFIFCSPHNPVSRVWTRSELEDILTICKKHDVVVISDEIHQDMVFNGHTHTPSACVGDFSDILVTVSAPSKTFNVAGCQNSFVIIEDATLRSKYLKHFNEMCIERGNPFGYIATAAAYKNGEGWLDEVKKIIWDNYIYLKEELKSAFSDIWVGDLQGTYLTWIDLGSYVKPDELESFIIDKCKIAPDFGTWFGGKNSKTCIRVNLATDRRNIEIVAKNIIEALRERAN